MPSPAVLRTATSPARAGEVMCRGFVRFSSQARDQNGRTITMITIRIISTVGSSLAIR